MTSLLSPLSSAWHSYWKQRLFWWVTLFLLFPSLMTGDLITSFFLERELLPISLLALLASIGLYAWGQACVLITGNGRRSFRTLLRDAQPLILPLLLTSILRQCLIFLWSLLLILPGILYAIRTLLFDVVIAMEGQQYRPALRRSAFIVRTHVSRTLTIIVAVYLLFFLPAYLLSGLEYFLPPLLPGIIPWNLCLLFLKNLLLAMGSALAFLTHIALYRELLTTGLAPEHSDAAPALYGEEPADDE